MNAIIVDFDGTIADSFDYVLDFLLQQAGRSVDALSPEERSQLKGLSMKALALRVGIPSWRLPLVYFRGKSAMHSRMGKTPPFKGIPQLLKTLHEEHYQLFIVSSNSRRNINRFLVEHGLGSYFLRIYGNAGWFGKGPTLKKVMQRHNLKPATTIYVGDEIRDVTAAHRAGMPVVAVSWGFGSEEGLLSYSPTVLVRKPAELEKTLIEWGRVV